jgi:hypothetical protein
MGTARVYIDTRANILAFGADKREDGRLAWATDTKSLFHVATAGVSELGPYVTKDAAGHVGILGNPIVQSALIITGQLTTTDSSQAAGLRVRPMVSSTAAPAPFSGIDVRPETPAVAVTYGAINGVLVEDAIKGAGSTITEYTSLRIKKPTVGTFNYAIVVEGGICALGDGIQLLDESVLKDVTYGADDSGGAGFKLLRIDN